MDVTQLLAGVQALEWGRVVMMAPPNKGSEVVGKLGHMKAFDLWTGPSGQELGTSTNSLVNRLGPVDYDLGIIAGSKSINPLYSRWVDGKDDGTVSIENTKVKGMKDFIVMHRTHTFMMFSKDVMTQVVHFLRHGQFRKP